MRLRSSRIRRVQRLLFSRLAFPRSGKGLLLTASVIALVLASAEFVLRPSGPFFDTFPAYILPDSTRSSHDAKIYARALSTAWRLSAWLERGAGHGGEPVVAIVGSSVAESGLSERALRESLQHELGVANLTVANLAVPGSLATDAYVAAHQALARMDVDVVIYAMGVRAFPPSTSDDSFNTPILRLWRDSSIPLAVGRNGSEDRITDGLKSVSRLYRYRELVRRMLRARAWNLWYRLSGARVVVADGRENQRQYRRHLEDDATRKRASRLRDSEAFMQWIERRNPAYRRIIAPSLYDIPLYGGNPYVAHLRALLEDYTKAGKRVVVLASPENPLFTSARPPYVDQRMREVFFGELRALAQSYGQSFLDCRDCMPSRFFVDLNHLTPAGQRRFSRDLASRLGKEFPDLLAGAD